jgi:hypothetical protein
MKSVSRAWKSSALHEGFVWKENADHPSIRALEGQGGRAPVV